MKPYSVSKEPNGSAQKELAEFSMLTQMILFNRDIKTKKEADIFLNPDYKRDVHDPFLILGMGRAVERILVAMGNKEKIVIYGDYDCDGIPGGVILQDFFKKIGYKSFSNYIPHRHTEGYSLNKEAIEQFAKDRVGLVITVDCGITDNEEVKHAGGLGIDVIITDHHIPEEVLPPAYVILNSKQKGDKYPDKMLCGAGVAWKLVQALLQKGSASWRITPGWEKWLLDMAGLATIADMVPLRGENRALAHFGLKVLRKSRRPGLVELLRRARVKQESLNEGDVAFMVAPRINAASRMDEPMAALNLLATKSQEEAGSLAQHLHKLNEDRKLTVARVTKEIKRTISKRELREVIVVGNPTWRIGVLGIAASNILDEYGKPTFVWGREEGQHIKGSVRAGGDVSVVELMDSVSPELFLDTGGHEASGGFTIAHKKIHLLEDELVRAYKKVKRKIKEEPLLIDKVMSLDEVTWGAWNEIERVGPFGVGNPAPVFLFEGIEISLAKTFGKRGEHMELRFKNGESNVPAIGFFMKSEDFGADISVGSKVNLIANMEKSTFRYTPELRLRIVDLEKVS